MKLSKTYVIVKVVIFYSVFSEMNIILGDRFSPFFIQHLCSGVKFLGRGFASLFEYSLLIIHSVLK
jgi:hypothetical protein